MMEIGIHRKCQVETKPGTDFSIYNLPIGIFSSRNKKPGAGIAIGDHIIDLRVMAGAGVFKGLVPLQCFEQGTLNEFVDLGPSVFREVRSIVRRILCGELQGFSILKEQALIRIDEATMHLPFEAREYTDFYSSYHHAFHVGSLFRDPDNAVLPNWKHLPVAYHGRSSSIISTGTDIIRPNGQYLNEEGIPVFGPSRKLDLEIEFAAVIGKGSERGRPIPLAEARDHIFGFVLLNDWSARDIQSWEYRPLGPFLGKNFATSISPWIVSPDALDSFRCPGPPQNPLPLPYLLNEGKRNYDIEIQADWSRDDSMEETLLKTNTSLLYWDIEQQIAHHTVNGCNLRPRDILASGTISGEEGDSVGCLLERTKDGREPLKMKNGKIRTYLEDGDIITFRAYAGEGPYRVGFGELRNRIVSSQKAE